MAVKSAIGVPSYGLPRTANRLQSIVRKIIIHAYYTHNILPEREQENYLNAKTNGLTDLKSRSRHYTGKFYQWTVTKCNSIRPARHL